MIVNRELNAPGFALMRRFDVLDQLAGVDCPTLGCVGSLDPITPVAASTCCGSSFSTPSSAGTRVKNR